MVDFRRVAVSLLWVYSGLGVPLTSVAAARAQDHKKEPLPLLAPRPIFKPRRVDGGRMPRRSQSPRPIFGFKQSSAPYQSEFSGLKEDELRLEHSDAISARNIFLSGGAIGLVGGTTLMLIGKNDIDSAAATPGCYTSGNTIYCSDTRSYSSASEKLSSGKVKFFSGMGMTGAGLAFAIVGYFKYIRAGDLEHEAMQRGIQLGFNPRRPDEVFLAYVYPF